MDENDSRLLSTILRYLETPQHFRKRLYPKSGLLQFVGALSPIKMPNQTGTSDAKQVKKGDVREGIIFPKDGKKFIDIGIDHSIPYHGKKQIEKRTIVKIKDTFQNFTVYDIEKDQIPNFRSYKGIHEMLDKKISNIQNFKAWNFFPYQGTETVRLEEAVLGCLSIINSYKFNK